MQLAEFNKSARSLVIQLRANSAGRALMLKIGDKVGVKGSIMSTGLLYDVADGTDKEGYVMISYNGHPPFRIHSSCLEKASG